MKLKVDFSKLTPADRFTASNAEEQMLLEAMTGHARRYIGSFQWCKEIAECQIGNVAVAGVVAVFLFKIVPAQRKVDEWLWVIVGDLPPAYFAADEARTPAEALGLYIEEMQLWVDAVKAGRSVRELIPVETRDGTAPIEPSPELAEKLEARLRYLEREALPR
jgi:hypothetical protein